LYLFQIKWVSNLTFAFLGAYMLFRIYVRLDDCDLQILP